MYYKFVWGRIVLQPPTGGCKIARTQNVQFCQFGVLFVRNSMSFSQKIVWTQNVKFWGQTVSCCDSVAARNCLKSKR